MTLDILRLISQPKKGHEGQRSNKFLQDESANFQLGAGYPAKDIKDFVFKDFASGFIFFWDGRTVLENF